MNEVKATLFIADKALNHFMASADLKPDYKVFVSNRQSISFTTKTEITPEYFLNLIEKSKTEKHFWIPAIQHNGVLYVSPEIKDISDGENSLFIRKN